MPPKAARRTLRKAKEWNHVTLFNEVAGRTWQIPSGGVRNRRRAVLGYDRYQDYAQDNKPFRLDNEFKLPDKQQFQKSIPQGRKRKRDDSESGDDAESFGNSSNEQESDEHSISLDDVKEEVPQGQMKYNRKSTSKNLQKSALLGQNQADSAMEDQDWQAKLPLNLRLPESESLKAIHTYSSDFYGSLSDEIKAGLKTGLSGHGTENDFHSLDGTALVAMGILLEELAANQLGEDGDLALLEPLSADATGSFYGKTSTTGQLARQWNGHEYVSKALKSYGAALTAGKTTSNTLDEESYTTDLEDDGKPSLKMNDEWEGKL